MRKIFLISLFVLSGCAYHNPLDKAGLRSQTLDVPPYVLAGWYRIDKPGAPLTVYVEKEQMDIEQKKAAADDKSYNVAYLGRPCQYIQTDICNEKTDEQKQSNAVKTGIAKLQKKARTETVIVKGF